MKAQVAIEYLILLALVLMLALITISLFDMFPDFGRAIQMKHSSDFWKNQARPFTISEAYLDTSNGRVYMLIDSKSSSSLKILNISLNNTPLGLFNYSESASAGLGDSLCDQYTCANGCVCDLDMSSFSSRAIATEYFADDSEVCGQKLKTALVDLQIIYYDMNSPLQIYTQGGPFSLVLECKGSFNN